ncbi:hypothetical protein [Kineosporia babensis]|uniref:Uncharacterized protein n=1 Tax=Kineosporia babensis TaxID=499548 RepID=A0A9X1SRX2_9ACTN|nr:hypothetical protein [Kineosporia babensis]MCD5309641.1 hypothetical protein [Kineosporia babensis]
MTSLRRAAASVVTAVTLASLALLAPAATASAAVAAPSAPAAPGIPSSECPLTPKLFTIYEKPTDVKFDVQSAYPYWSMRFTSTDLGTAGPYSLPDGQDRVHRFSSAKLLNSTAGLVPAKVDLITAEGEVVGTCNTSFRMRRGTSVSASVKKLKSGRQVSGTLKRVDFGKPAARAWIGFKGQEVEIQMKKKGEWVGVAWTKTQAGGKFRTTLKTTKKSQWRVEFGGTGTTGSRVSKTITK